MSAFEQKPLWKKIQGTACLLVLKVAWVAGVVAVCDRGKEGPAELAAGLPNKPSRGWRGTIGWDSVAYKS